MPLIGQQPDIAEFLSKYPKSLAEKPAAVLLVTAHWEMPVATVSTNPKPSLYFDYGGFPAETYEYKYPAPGATDVASRVKQLLEAAKIDSEEDAKRGWDHGVFVPMMLMYPDADVPVCMISLCKDQDAAHHIAIGKALETLRKESVLIVGSGYTFHNMNAFFSRGSQQKEYWKHAASFDTWLREVLVNEDLEAEDRLQKLSQWEKHPSARMCHPEGGAEHLLPLLVASAAAGGAAAKAYAAHTSTTGIAAGLAASHFDWK